MSQTFKGSRFTFTNSDGALTPDILIKPGQNESLTLQGPVTIDGDLISEVTHFSITSTTSQATSAIPTTSLKLSTCFGDTGTSTGTNPPTHVASSGNFVINQSGTYIIVANITYTGAATNFIETIMFGDTDFLASTSYCDQNTGDPIEHNLTAVAELTDGDVITLFVKTGTQRTIAQTTGSTLTKVSITKL